MPPGAAGRRLQVVAEGKALRRVRDRVREEPLPFAELVAELDTLTAYSEVLDVEVARLDPAVVVALGPEALVLAASLGRAAVYVPGPARSGVRGEAVDVVERRWKSRMAAVLPAGAPASVWGPALRGAGVPDAPDALPVLDPEPRQLLPGVRLGIGPANFAGQGWAWGSAVRDHLDAGVDVVAVQRSSFDFPADITPTAEEWDSLEWQLEYLPRALSWTHALSESLRPLLGLLNGSVVSGDLAAFRRAGVSLAVLCHGSEVRSPRMAAALYEHAPFGARWPDNAALQETSDRNVRLLPGIGGPVFVATPDLLDSVPFGVWLPIVVDEADFAPAPAVLERDVPVVVHAPTNPRFKGTDAIEPVLLALEAEGLLEYRRYGSLQPSEVAGALREADVLVDHVVIGNYATLSIQALAAGRVVLGHVHERVRRRIPLETPIVETTPDTVEQVLRGVLSDRSSARETAGRGPAFARTLHDGRLSARVLAGWLGANASLG